MNLERAILCLNRTVWKMKRFRYNISKYYGEKS